MKLAMLAVAGQTVAYFLAVVLARQLGVEGFEAYAVASAAFTLMVMYAPRGLEKYSLRLLPALFERSDWERARGFLQFGLRRTFWISVLVAVAVYLCVQYFSEFDPVIKLAISVSCLSLPTGALVHYYVEVLSANGRDILATAIFRVAVPTTTLTLIGLLLSFQIDISGAMAVGCWGIAWTLALAVMVIPILRTTPPQVWPAKPTKEASTWAREARPFHIYRISQALLAQVGVIALDQLQPSAAAVGGYVAAVSTVNMALVLATSTNRFYSRRLSILLEQQNYAGVLKWRRERLRWLLPTMGIFLTTVFYFGREILAFFRPEFVEEGIIALYLLAIATTISVLFSLAPTYLKFRKHNRALIKIVVGAATMQLILLLLLVPRFAATGAAIAYAISMCGMYGIFSRLALRELGQLKANDKTV
jgi:O-antigen/teichoic acid export membrane protein